MERNIVKTLVISAVNLTEGGPLTILRDAVTSAEEYFDDNWEIVVLAHSRDIVLSSRVKVLPFNKSKKSWIMRLYYEWWGFRGISKRLKPDLWLSLHDITPIVYAARQAVYCHNPSPFYILPIKEALCEPILLLFNMFYALLYRINIKRNYAVVVQQEWLREEFWRRYRIGNVIVAHPEVLGFKDPALSQDPAFRGEARHDFLFPALPRVFKNHQAIGEAVRILRARGRSGFTVSFTLRGDENAYAAFLLRKYSSFKEIKFLGRLGRAEMITAYRDAIAVIFPSKLETWGLPISEAISMGKRLIVVDLPYAHETVGQYQDVVFFNLNDSIALADVMEAVLDGRWEPSGNAWKEPAQPFTESWAGLWALLSKGL